MKTSFKCSPLARWVCLLLLSFISVQAQGGAQEEKPLQQVGLAGAGLSFTCLLWEGPLERQLFYRDGDSLLPLVSSTGTRSRVYRLQRSSEFVLYLREPGVGEERLSFTLAGRSPIPEGGGQVLFLLFPEGSDEAPQIRILAMDDSLESFPAGTFRFVNFTGESLAVNFARRDGTVPSQGMLVMESGVTPQGGMVPCLISNGQGERIFETRLFAQASGREIVFISPPGVEQERIGVRFISQLLPRRLPASRAVSGQ